MTKEMLRDNLGWWKQMLRQTWSCLLDVNEKKLFVRLLNLKLYIISKCICEETTQVSNTDIHMGMKRKCFHQILTLPRLTVLETLTILTILLNVIGDQNTS